MKMGPSCVSRGAEESCPSVLTVGTDSLASLRLMSSLYEPLSHEDMGGRGRKMIHLCHSPICPEHPGVMAVYSEGLPASAGCRE